MLEAFLLNNLSTIIALIVGSVSYRKLNRPLKLLYYLIVVMVAVESYAFYRGQILNRPNHWMYHIYMIIEFTLLMNVFKRWQIDRFVIKFIKNITWMFVLLCLVNYFFFSDYFVFFSGGRLCFNFNVLYNFWPIRVACVFYTALSAYTLFQLLRDDKGNIIQLSAFWASSGLLIFASGSIVFFVGIALHEELNIINPRYLVAAFSIMNIVSQLLYAVSFWIQNRYGQNMNMSNNINDLDSTYDF